MASFPADADRSFSLARLPREIINSIFSHYVSMAGPLRYLIPFLTANAEWFELACPHVWSDVCMNTIACEGIKTAERRQLYAEKVQRIRDAKDCGCRHCMERTTTRPRPRGRDFGNQAPRGLSEADIAVLQTLSFPRLHTLEFARSKHTTPELLQALRRIGKSATRLKTLHIKCWEEVDANVHVNEESATHWRPGHTSLINMISDFEGELEHVIVEEVARKGLIETPIRPCRWDKLISAELFSGPHFDQPEDHLTKKEFPSPDICLNAISLISQAPKLQRLSVFIPRAVGSMVYPDKGPSGEAADVEAARRAFPALTQLSVAIQSHLTLRDLPDVKNLTQLRVRFDPYRVKKGILDVLRRLTQLTQLELLANRKIIPGPSWIVQSNFTVADVAAVIEPMEELELFRFNFPAFSLRSSEHPEAAHSLLLSIATHNQKLTQLHLGFAVPFPLKRWPRLTGEEHSQLQVLTTESSTTYEYPPPTTVHSVQYIAIMGKRLRRIFPELRTFTTNNGSVRVKFA